MVGADERNDRQLWLLLGGIQEALETIKGTLGEDRITAAQYRTDMRKELETIKNGNGDMKADMRIAKEDISAMKPKIDVLEQQRHTSAGVAQLASWIWWGIYALLPVIGGIVALQFQRWTSGK